MGSGQFQECDESEKTNKPSSKTPQKSGRTESNNIALDNCQILKLPTLPTHSSNIPTKVYGHGVERAEVVLQSPGDFLKEILNTHDGICLGDVEHNKTLFQSLANDLPQLKEAGLKNIFIEVSIDEQKNINNYLKTGDLSFLAIFPDDVNQYGAQLSSSSYSKSFFQKCREMGIDVTCMDVSNERNDALVKKYKNLGVGGQNLQQDAFRNRSDDVGNEQTEKELYEFIEARYAHNEDWVNVISEKLSQSEKGKFLIIGGNAHFLKELHGKERISIQD
jgi:hypothetical protein